jgi:choline dehydrogenase-like flavoprotein
MKVKYSSDYVIIGSGAGGGIVYKELKKNNLNCLIVEKGNFYNSNDFKKGFLHSLKNMWAGAGYQHASNDSFFKTQSYIPITQGVCVGGSTVINGGKMRDIEKNYILELKKIFKNEHIFDYKKLLSEQSELKDFFGIKKNIQHVVDNSKIKKVCDQLGYEVQATQRSAPKCRFSDICINGCPNNAKNNIQNMVFHDKNNNDILSNVEALRFVINNNKANFLECKKENETFFIKAKYFILSAGVVGSPKILLNSDISNKNIGKNLRLHLSTSVIGSFDVDRFNFEILPMGYDIKTNNHLVGNIFSQATNHEITLTKLPYIGKNLMHYYKNINKLSSWYTSINSTSVGQIKKTNFGNIKIIFQPSKQDLEKIVLCNKYISHFLFKLTARKVFLSIKDLNMLTSIKDLDLIDRCRLVPQNFLLAASHLFGTCPPDFYNNIGVIDKDFRVKGINNLFILDASILPIMPNYNPQLTIMCVIQSLIKSMINKFN